MKKTARHGFTLVELLVVVSIIAVLSAIGITMYSSAQRLARDAKRRADLQSIQQALELYNSINGYYPKTATGWFYSDSATDPWLIGMDTNYMSRLPKDPQNTGGHPYSGGYTYGYYTEDYTGRTNGEYYVLIAHLEAPNSDDLTTKCVMPVTGYSYGSTNSGADSVWKDNIFFCNRR